MEEKQIIPAETGSSEKQERNERKKSKNIRISLFSAVILSLVLCIAAAISTFTIMKNQMNYELSKRDVQLSRYNKFGSLMDFVEKEYVRGITEDELFESVYSTLFQSTGDPYSLYMNAEEYKEYLDDRAVTFVGVGINVIYDAEAGGIRIYRVTPGSPAEKAGLKKGDLITGVEGISVSIQTYQEAINAVKGEENSEVRFTVKRGEKLLSITAVRGVCPTVEVYYEKIGSSAYIQILSFRTRAAFDQFKQALQQAKNDRCLSYIFDIRNNPGGDLGVICDVLDLMIKDKTLVHMVAADGSETTKETKTNEELIAPMVVLCNGNSASAAELFTADLRENRNAYIVGTKTYGKGTMQTVRTLSDGSAFKLTNRFYNPTSNVSYDGIGIVPDLEVKLTSDQESRFYLLTHEEDPQLQAAIAYLTK